MPTVNRSVPRLLRPVSLLQHQPPPASDGDPRQHVVNCVGSWSPFEECSATCGEGSQESVFTITVPASPKGKKCAVSHGARRSQPCFAGPCAAKDGSVPASAPINQPTWSDSSLEGRKGERNNGMFHTTTSALGLRMAQSSKWCKQLLSKLNLCVCTGKCIAHRDRPVSWSTPDLRASPHRCCPSKYYRP